MYRYEKKEISTSLDSIRVTAYLNLKHVGMDVHWCSKTCAVWLDIRTKRTKTPQTDEYEDQWLIDHTGQFGRHICDRGRGCNDDVRDKLKLQREMEHLEITFTRRISEAQNWAWRQKSCRKLRRYRNFGERKNHSRTEHSLSTVRIMDWFG